MSLALYKAAAIWKENKGLANLELVKILVQDQVVYFLAWVYLFEARSLLLNDALLHRVILVSVFRIIAGTTIDENLVLIIILSMVGSPAFLSVLGTRLLFNMKEAGVKGLNQGTSCNTRSTMSDIRFTETFPTLASPFQHEKSEAAVTETKEVY